MTDLILLLLVSVVCVSGLYAQAQHYKHDQPKAVYEATPMLIDMGERMDKIEAQCKELKSTMTQMQLKEGFKR